MARRDETAIERAVQMLDDRNLQLVDDERSRAIIRRELRWKRRADVVVDVCVMPGNA